MDSADHIHISLSVFETYLKLYHCDELPNGLFSALIRKYGSIAELLVAAAAGFPAKEDFEKTRPDRVKLGLTIIALAESSGDGCHYEADILWLGSAEEQNHKIICYEDPRYPSLLREIPRPPPLLYLKGHDHILTGPQLAVVGSRKASSLGRRTALWMANSLAEAGLIVTSGLALGIDSQAHYGALAQGKPTIGVIGTGIDVNYPKANSGLATDIAKAGAIVSEFRLGTKPLARHFPQRNRIISGMSLGTLVIEAQTKSGSLITAQLAIEQNRDVFAVPGAITNPHSSGCHQLIKQGAMLVESADDILGAINQCFTKSIATSPIATTHIATTPITTTPITTTPKIDSRVNSDTSKLGKIEKVSSHLLVSSNKIISLFKLIEHDRLPLEMIMLHLNEDISVTSATLAMLESEGLVSLQGGRYGVVD